MITTDWPESEVREFFKIKDGISFSHETMHPSALMYLIEIGAADPTDAQNASPSIKEFIEEFNFGEEDTIYEGYVVLPPRDDRRVSIDGVTFVVGSAEEALEVISNGWARSADECDYDKDAEGRYHIRLWWD